MARTLDGGTPVATTRAHVEHFLVDVASGRGSWGLRIEGSSQWLATCVELAGSSASRRRGLRGREQLAAGTALVIAPSQGVHTFGMRFALDLVGVTRTGDVVTVRAGVGPRRAMLSFRAFAIVELAEGACARSGLQVGDRLVAAPTPSSGWAGAT